MTRNFKVLGLALVAVFAMTAVFASAASAQFESEASSTTLTTSDVETQKFQIKSGGLTVECDTLTLQNATQSGTTATTVSVEPVYGSCNNLLGQSVSIDTNGCDYVFHLADNATNGTTDVECPTSTGFQITIGSICTYEVDTQTGLSSIDYSNDGTGTTREVQLNPDVSGIVSSRTTNDFFCPAASSEGTYKGESQVTGENADGHVGIFVD